jgi:hypothetical protein
MADRRGGRIRSVVRRRAAIAESGRIVDRDTTVRNRHVIRVREVLRRRVRTAARKIRPSVEGVRHTRRQGRRDRCVNVGQGNAVMNNSGCNVSKVPRCRITCRRRVVRPVRDWPGRRCRIRPGRLCSTPSALVVDVERTLRGHRLIRERTGNERRAVPELARTVVLCALGLNAVEFAQTPATHGSPARGRAPAGTRSTLRQRHGNGSRGWPRLNRSRLGHPSQGQLSLREGTPLQQGPPGRSCVDLSQRPYG